jgi:signal peptidase I
LQLPQRAKPQFSYSVALDGKTPINEYLLKDLDITDQVYYKNNETRDTLLFRALTVAGARLKIYPELLQKQEIAQGTEDGYSEHK